jgi:hypothetical protein
VDHETESSEPPDELRPGPALSGVDPCRRGLRR